MKSKIFRVGFGFGGSGPGSRGMLEARVMIDGVEARFECAGSMDIDPVACADYEYLTGKPSLCIDVRQMTPARMREWYGLEAPDLIFGSPPCQGASRLLSAKKAKAQKYQDLNELTEIWIDLILAAWPTKPPKLILIENVATLPSRAPEMLDRVRAKLQKHGYVFNEDTHDCGEIGGLAQHRARFLLVARHAPSCDPLLYVPPKQRVRGVGEVLGLLPMPATLEAKKRGAMHVLPRITWKNWLRLAHVPAGGDHRDLDGVLQGRARREVHRRHAVQSWTEAHPAVTGPGGHSVTAVADPRIAMSDNPNRHDSKLRVLAWRQPSPTVITKPHPSSGTASVADPRIEALRVANAYDAGYGVLRWTDPARTIAGNPAAGAGAYAVAEIRERIGFLPEVRVMTLDDACSLDLDLEKAPPFIPVIIAADGTWHRPMTLLELAALQGIPDMIDGKPLAMHGTREEIATHIGNAVPSGAARAIGTAMLSTLLSNAIGSWSLSSGAVWTKQRNRHEQAPRHLRSRLVVHAQASIRARRRDGVRRGLGKDRARLGSRRDASRCARLVRLDRDLDHLG
jgi:site-specific DNA-cytosine methylase